MLAENLTAKEIKKIDRDSILRIRVCETSTRNAETKLTFGDNLRTKTKNKLNAIIKKNEKEILQLKSKREEIAKAVINWFKP